MEDFAPGFQLFQVRPSATTDVTTAFTPTVKSEIQSLFICNTSGSAATAYVYHDDDGSTFDETSALLWNIAVAADTTIVLEAAELNGGIVVQSGGNIGVKPSAASALTFTGYGVRRRKNLR